MAMTYSKSGLQLTENFEGCRLTAYQDDGGVWTLGYGHTRMVHEGSVCTQAQAVAWLMDDVQNAAGAVNRLVTVTLTQDEFDALVDFVFNLGVGNFAKSTLLRLLNKGDFAGAADQFDLWDHDDGKIVQGLLRRRLAEEKEFDA